MPAPGKSIMDAYYKGKKKKEKETIPETKELELDPNDKSIKEDNSMQTQKNKAAYYLKEDLKKGKK